MLIYYTYPETSTEIFLCFTSKLNAYGTFLNMGIKINYKINIFETSIIIELKFVCSLFSRSRINRKIMKFELVVWKFKNSAKLIPSVP